MLVYQFRAFNPSLKIESFITAVRFSIMAFCKSRLETCLPSPSIMSPFWQIRFGDTYAP